MRGAQAAPEVGQDAHGLRFSHPYRDDELTVGSLTAERELPPLT
jgi:hypothetical protein